MALGRFTVDSGRQIKRVLETLVNFTDFNILSGSQIHMHQEKGLSHKQVGMDQAEGQGGSQSIGPPSTHLLTPQIFMFFFWPPLWNLLSQLFYSHGTSPYSHSAAVLLHPILFLLLGSGAHTYTWAQPCSLMQVSTITGARTQAPHSQVPSILT